MTNELPKEEVRETRSAESPVQRVIGVLFTILTVLLLFRFGFKLLGANPDNVFVDLIYRGTRWMVGPFDGIFSPADLSETQAGGVFEPSVVIALIVLAVVYGIIQRLIFPGLVHRVERSRGIDLPAPDVRQDEDNNGKDS